MEASRMDSFAPDVLTVTDGSGQERQFEILDRVEGKDGISCLAVVPIFENKEDILSDIGDFDIVKLKEEDGGFVLTAVDDPDEFDSLYKNLEKRIEKKLYVDF